MSVSVRAFVKKATEEAETLRKQIGRMERELKNLEAVIAAIGPLAKEPADEKRDTFPMAILEALGESTMRVPEIAKAAGVPFGSMYRLMADLIRSGAVEKVERGLYRRKWPSTEDGGEA